MKTNSFILRATFRKLSLSAILVTSAVIASATLGDGKLNRDRPHRPSLSLRSTVKPGSFSLQSGYSFRGNQVINFQADRFLNLNTVATYQQGHTVYTVPLKKKVLLNGKLTFNPNAATRN